MKPMRCLVLLLLSTALFQSCGRKWKEPSAVSYQFRIRPAQVPGLFSITSGQMVLEEMEFEGSREQGQKNIFLEKVYSDGYGVNLNTSYLGSGITFDIPQGTYNEIRLKLKLRHPAGGNCLVLNGRCLNSNGDTLRVLFEFRDNETIEMKAKTAGGGDEIVLVADMPASALLDIDANGWFSTVTQNMIDAADTTWISNLPYMLVNENDNQDIYDIIIDRIKDGNETVF